MKNYLVILLSILFLFSSSTTRDRDPKDNGLAVVNQVEGLYIFSDSKPVEKYTYLGTVKGNFVWSSGQYESIRDALIKKARKNYQNFDGLILNLKDQGIDKADVIKFEN